MEIKITTPEMPELSKNEKYFFNNKGSKKAIKPDFKKAVDFIFYKINIITNNNKIQFKDKEKVMISFTHYRKGHTSDAHNFTEGVCDAIKGAIGVDDRYFKTIFDYEIDKENPRFEITITQGK